MTQLGPFVKLSLDESALEKMFAAILARLDKHDQQFLDFEKQLNDRPTKQDLRDLNNSLLKEIDSRTDKLNKRIDELSENLNQKLKDLENNFDQRLQDMANMLNLTIMQKIDDIESRIPNSDTQINDFIDRLQAVEETTFNNGKKLHLTRDAVQQIASSICLLNNTNAVLDQTLPETLKAAINTIPNNFKQIMDQLAKLKDRVNTNTVKERTIERVTSALKPEAAPSEQSGQQGTVIDLSPYHPYPACVAHWRDPPDLPPTPEFMNIGEVVDYIYKLVPKLQAHLTAMQGKIVENAQDILGKVDKGLVEKMFEKFQAVIGEMAGRVDELKDCIEQTATRDEINSMVEDIFNSMSQGGQTAIGRVRCIACGREIPQVTGATTEEESNRMLGVPPNSIISGNKSAGQSNLGVLYSKRDGFDSAIIESPRSVRPFKPSTSRQKTPR